MQQALLKILEGTVASVPPQGGRKHPHQDFLQIDTKNVLFICGGAFGGLEEIIRQRIGKKSIGFGSHTRLSEEDSILQFALPDDSSSTAHPALWVVSGVSTLRAGEPTCYASYEAKNAPSAVQAVLPLRQVDLS